MINYNNEIELKGKQILLFSTEWCGDCIVLKMYIDEVVAENSAWEFIYIDSDVHPDLAASYNVLGIPSFVALNDGSVVDTLINKDPKPKQMINDWISNINV